MLCKVCGKPVTKSDIILTIKETGQRIVDVEVCHREKCHDELEKEKIISGFSCGFYEMDKTIKDIILQDEFMLNRFEDDALTKYRHILQWCNA